MLYCDRAVGSFFMVRRLSKIVSHHGWLKTYNFRMKLAKTFRMFQVLTFRITVPPKKNNSKPHFRVDFLISYFLVESLKPKKDQKKKITHFTIQFRSKNLIHFTSLASLKYAPATRPKTLLTSQIFKQTCFWLVL